ncbi:uncharacterized protein LOC142769003 [Rhipicephalus microplus]|uniref:uncharacterized protein LOC142769003 n=1 Tax=Rhipicephalus microplus TaxID=6941 RepID=UPI003F6D2699
MQRRLYRVTHGVVCHLKLSIATTSCSSGASYGEMGDASKVLCAINHRTASKREQNARHSVHQYLNEDRLQGPSSAATGYSIWTVAAPTGRHRVATSLGETMITWSSPDVGTRNEWFTFTVSGRSRAE